MKTDKVVSTIEKYQMLEKGDRVAVGFSGGADSVCLLHTLYTLKDRYNLDLVACHINHMLRGEEADRDEKFCRDFCDKYGIKIVVLRVDVAKIAEENKESIELCARKIRYDFFEKYAGTNGKIATAHTLNDSLETMLFNMMRGTALKGLCGIPEKRGNIVRPLIELTRQEIEEYCKENRLYFVTDSTNNTDEYTRNRIRHKIIPQMQAESNSLYSSYLSMHKALSRDEEFLNGFADQILEKARKNNGYDAKELAHCHDSILIRCVAKLFSEFSVSIDTAKLELVCDIIKKGRGKVNLAPNVYATVSKSTLTVEQETKQDYFEFPLGENEIEVFEGKYISFKHQQAICSKKVNQNLLKKYIDCDKIGRNVVVRQKKDGDQIRLASNKMTKTLKKLFNERGISVSQRDKVLVVCDEEGPVWVEGFGVAQRCAVNEETKNIGIIEVKGRTGK